MEFGNCVPCGALLIESWRDLHTEKIHGFYSWDFGMLLFHKKTEKKHKDITEKDRIYNSLDTNFIWHHETERVS